MCAERSRNPETYRIDDLVVDTGARRVFRGKQELELPKLSFDMLVALILAAPNTLSIDELIERVWAGVVVSPATVAKRVELLRQVLGEESQKPRYVALVRGHGYRLIPAPEQVLRGVEKRPSRSIPGVGAAAVATAAIALLAVIAVTGWYLLNESEPPPVRSIAVLPFANLSPASENEFLSDGLATELTNLLTTLPDLKVAARTSAFAFKGRNTDIKDIAGQLRVAHILSGSVRQSGDTLRITAQLVDANDGYHIWSNSWERELTDIFEIQDEIAGAVIDSLRVRMLQEKPAAQRVDPEAFALYLQGREAFLDEMEPDTDEEVPDKTVRAAALITHALAIEPDYAPAWGQLAAIQYSQAQWMTSLAAWTPEDQAEAYARAEASARRALELDPGQRLALSMLGAIYDEWHWDAAAAARWYSRALAAAPGNAGTLNAIAILYGRLGRPDIAHRFMLEANERDPLSKGRAINLARSYWVQGEFDAARAQLEHARQITPNALRVQVLEGLFAYREGNFAEAAELFGDLNPPLHACSLLKMERRTDALAVLQELRSTEPPPAYGIAAVYACRNDPDKAFAWLQRAVEDHDPAVRWMRANVDLESLHDDPRWEALLRQVGLSDDDYAKVVAELGTLGR